MPNFKLNVTQLVATVEKEQLLFYPVIIYLLAKTLKRLNCNYTETAPSYVFVNDNQTPGVLWTTYQEKFSTFWHDYVQDCCQFAQSFRFFPKGQFQAKTFLVSYIPFTQISLLAETQMPRFLLGRFEQVKGQKLLPIEYQGFAEELDFESFFETLQNLCNSFTF